MPPVQRRRDFYSLPFQPEENVIYAYQLPQMQFEVRKRARKFLRSNVCKLWVLHWDIFGDSFYLILFFRWSTIECVFDFNSWSRTFTIPTQFQILTCDLSLPHLEELEGIKGLIIVYSSLWITGFHLYCFLPARWLFPSIIILLIGKSWKAIKPLIVSRKLFLSNIRTFKTGRMGRLL